MSIQDHKTILLSLLRFGLPQTLKLVGVCLVLALVIGIVLGVIRSFRIPVIDQILGFYAMICRGVPVMIILLFVYSALYLGTPYWTAVVTLTFSESAYIMEIVKGGLLSIDKGQWEAADSLSLPKAYTVVKVIIPQVFLVTLPAIFGQLVLLIKGTAVASTVGVVELTKQGQFLLSSYSQPIIVYGYVLIIFFLICHLLTSISRRLEKRIRQKIIGESHEK